MERIKYNTYQFNFPDCLLKIFNEDKKSNITDLSTLNEDIELLTREKDQSTKWHKLYYDYAYVSGFLSLYDKFIAEVIKPLYGEKIVYQAIPTFRVCYPNNVAVGEFHKDKHYRDNDWALMVQEDNFFLPFTDAFDTNTVWVESEEDKGDFFPMKCKYGEVIKWDGSNLMHGNKLNTTGQTRVSVDFRVIKYRKYIPSENGSINTKSKFQIGDYYKLI